MEYAIIAICISKEEDKNMNNRFLRSVLSVGLVLCMLVSTPIAALASGQTPAQVAVADAVDFCAKAQQIVDIIVDLAVDGDYASIFGNATLREAFKDTAIDEIKKVLDDNESLMQEFGFEPTDANIRKLVDSMMVVWGKRPEYQYPIIMDALQYIKG